MRYFSSLLIKYPHFLLFVLLLSYGTFAQGQEAFSIGTSTATWAGGIIQFFQELVNLIGGPVVAVVVFAALAFALFTWINDPRGQGLAWAFRALIGGLGLAAIGAVLSSMGIGGGGGGGGVFSSLAPALFPYA